MIYKYDLSGKFSYIIDDNDANTTCINKSGAYYCKNGLKLILIIESITNDQGTDLTPYIDLTSITNESFKIVGVDSLGYLRLEDVTKLGESGKCKGYCTACFDGKYPTEIPQKIINKFDHKISESEN